MPALGASAASSLDVVAATTPPASPALRMATAPAIASRRLVLLAMNPSLVGTPACGYPRSWQMTPALARL